MKFISSFAFTFRSNIPHFVLVCFFGFDCEVWFDFHIFYFDLFFNFSIFFFFYLNGEFVDDGNRESMAGYVVPKQETKDGKSIKIRVNPITQTTAMSLPNALQQLQHDSLNNNSPTLERASSPQSHSSPATLAMTPPAETPATSSSVASATTTTASTTTTISTPTSGSTRQPVRRRIRRKANSAVDDPAEQLTEMSVRGLNLFRYASINEGVYQCTECAKDNIQKTFKNKYSFQRHAFLYHEGTQRKVFPCPVCGKEFSRPDKMKNHMKTTHECYMPKDCVYPLNFLVGAGIENASIPKMEKIETAMPTTQWERQQKKNKTRTINEMKERHLDLFLEMKHPVISCDPSS